MKSRIALAAFVLTTIGFVNGAAAALPDPGTTEEAVETINDSK